MAADPAYLNTASCRSAITYIDGDAGILRYRGYPIEQLTEEATFLETAFLLLEGELPTAERLHRWEEDVRYHTYVHTNVQKFLGGLPLRRAPDGDAARRGRRLSTFYPDAKDIGDPDEALPPAGAAHGQAADHRRVRLPARTRAPLRAAAQRPRLHRQLRQHDLRDRRAARAEPGAAAGARDPPRAPRRPRAELLDERRPRGRVVTRRPVLGRVAGIAALYGPLHGGANEAVLRMLDQIGSKETVPGFIEQVKGGKGRLMGFGHRVYKSYDPRAKLIKRVADDVFEQTGLNPKLEIALELERIALEDEYFVSRRLYPNVDFYSGLIYQAMGYPTDYFTVLFALGRLPGWIAQWEEMLGDPEQEDLAAAAGVHRRARAAVRPARRARLTRGDRRGRRGARLACLGQPCASTTEYVVLGPGGVPNRALTA